MKRAIVVPALLAGVALNEFKGWLGITTTSDDAALTSLLRSAVDICEAFTGQMPLEALCEELLPPNTGWQILSTRPVMAITNMAGIGDRNVRNPISPDDYALELNADGSARVRILRPMNYRRYAARFTAGLASDWSELPEGLRHGILRLAAHHYRRPVEAGLRPMPTRAVAALWQPWRRMRLIGSMPRAEEFPVSRTDSEHAPLV